MAQYDVRPIGVTMVNGIPTQFAGMAFDNLGPGLSLTDYEPTNFTNGAFLINDFHIALNTSVAYQCSNGTKIIFTYTDEYSSGAKRYTVTIKDSNDVDIDTIYIYLDAYTTGWFGIVDMYNLGTNIRSRALAYYRRNNLTNKWTIEHLDVESSVSPYLEFDTYGTDPYETAPDAEPDGGYGDYDYSGDNIPIPALPSWSVVDSGFVTLYKPSISQIKSLAQYLWSGLFDLSTYKKIFADPMDCIISLSRVPINAGTSGTQTLTVGNISTGLSFDVLSDQFVKVSFKSKNIGLRANGFLDYAPYVKAQIYLPFIGMRALSIDDIAGKDLKLEYNIDLFTGACTAYLECAVVNSNGATVKSVLYQFTGNVLANIPITQANYSSFIQSVIGAAAKTGSALISGGAAAAGAAAISSGINVAANIKPDIERSGNMTATGGILGIKKPYLIVTYPNVCKPRNREKTVGIPSFVGLGIQGNGTNLKLSDFKGFTILHKINVKNIPCTDVERQMIETQLTTEGVIL